MEISNKNWKLTRTPEEAENVIIGLLCTTYTRTVEDLVARYGQEAIEIARNAFIASMVEPLIEQMKDAPNRDLSSFIDWLVSGIGVGHQGEFVEKTDTSVKFRFTECPYATIFRASGKQEIGKFFCDADGPLASAWNENIIFERTKTLMEGDDHCNHHYFIRSETSLPED